MDAKKIFRVLLIASVILAFAGAAIPAFELYETSEDLEVVLMWGGYGGVFWSDDGEITNPLEVALLVVVVFVIAVMVVGSISTFLFKNWGRVLLAVTAVISILAMPTFGLFVALSVEMMFFELSGAVF